MTTHLTQILHYRPPLSSSQLFLKHRFTSSSSQTYLKRLPCPSPISFSPFSPLPPLSQFSLSSPSLPPLPPLLSSLRRLLLLVLRLSTLNCHSNLNNYSIFRGSGHAVINVIARCEIGTSISAELCKHWFLTRCEIDHSSEETH